MNSRKRERRSYIRSAVLSFGCTAVCIGIDIYNFIRAGRIYVDWKIAVSVVIYILLIFLGIRAIKKAL